MSWVSGELMTEGCEQLLFAMDMHMIRANRSGYWISV